MPIPIHAASAPRALWDLDPVLAGETAHRLGEGQVLDLHQEGERVAPLLAAEAVVGTAIGIDMERRGLLAVERTQTLVAAARALERDAAPDELTRSTRSRTCWMISSGMRPTDYLALTAPSAHLLESALARCRRLLLLPDAGLVVVLAALELAENARLLALLLEALHRDFERLVVSDLDHRHPRPPYTPMRQLARRLLDFKRLSANCCGRLTIGCVEFASPN
jgi:hypothetical protein